MTWTISNSNVVLIVDDVPANLALLSDALNDSGHTVLVATDGLSALERLNFVVPDLILLDAVMPGLDGFETCRRIKQMRSASDIPVVFMTGLTETEHVVKGFEVGGVDYVTKPIQPRQVIARITTHIRSARMMARARTAIDAADHAVIVLGPDRQPVWQTAKAIVWLDKYFDDGGSTAAALPRMLDDWLLQRLAVADADEQPAAPLCVTRADTQLNIRLSRGDAGSELLLYLEERRIAAPLPDSAQGLADFRLTPRESEVLAWVAKGKTNRDIAEIVGMSPRTVNKHLEHIYVKLGVETRSAAAALVASRMGGGNP
ncbi:response regulator transcription factor [Noviherbaspirillum sp.]|uniref:response regulator transcription factor n=1 Tax=Noviherbaspirillum sp. TaxID=1926288 RepID=UPI002FDF3260